ncbi:MAG: Rrf2 family transcriptional regulator [Leptospiraceae bacterium]|nr:Rrf2 family transcriptional regulator [Leptospiraceae bacterium]
MKTEYALRALYQLSLAKDSVHRSQISEDQGIPAPYLEQILISLKKAGLVRSIRGPGGGYQLAKPGNQITVWDIYSAVEMPAFSGERCFPGMKNECDRLSACKIKNVWAKINTSVRESMQSLTLNSITA